MHYVESFNLFGVPAKQLPCILGSGAPLTTTEGAVGLFYMDTANGEIYKCTAITSSGAYTWEKFASGGSGSGTGSDGGYYTPAIRQTGDNTMLVSFAPSKVSMDDVQPVTITLPSGKDGEAGVGITKLEQTIFGSGSEADNVWTMVLSNGLNCEFVVKNGSRGPSGPSGPAGKTPIRGTDYWTPDDIAEIKGYVDNAILGGAW